MQSHKASRGLEYALGGDLDAQELLAHEQVVAVAQRGRALHAHVRAVLGTEIGLNDFVTVERPDYTPEKLRNLPPADNYEAWLDWSEKRPSDATSMRACADDMYTSSG